MSEADEMLEEVGLIKSFENKEYAEYHLDFIARLSEGKTGLLFNKKEKFCHFYQPNALRSVHFSDRLLKAVFAKCKELGWLE